MLKYFIAFPLFLALAACLEATTAQCGLSQSMGHIVRGGCGVDPADI